jgi:hypothetical protein
MATDDATSRSQPEAVRQQPSQKEAARAAVPAAVPATFAGMPPTAQTFYAVVNADGSLARGFGVVSTTAFGGGDYEVIFSQDITGSAYIATIGLTGSLGISAPGQVSVVGRFENANGVFVQTSDSTGNPTNLGFHLAVHS